MRTVREVADKMYEMIAAEKGRKKPTARDLQFISMEVFGEDVDKDTCNNAVKHLADTGSCVY